MFDPKNLLIDNPHEGVFRVRRSAMTSVEVLQMEQERIFNKCWLYLCHESEVENPGDYRRRNVAGRPLFFIRGSDGKLRVFLNTCTHRGAQICRHDQGHADVLQCFYHAWSFSNQGDLVGVPDEAAYADSFNRAEMGLKSPPRVESYRGFIFVSFNPQVEDLMTYLAGAREYLDLIVDQAEKGMRIIRGSNRYSIKANWKLLVENSLDGYHVRPTHKTYFEYVNGLGINTGGVQTAFSRPARLSSATVMQWRSTTGSGAGPSLVGARCLAKRTRRKSPRFAHDWRGSSASRKLGIWPTSAETSWSILIS